jgi:hypothetical protein
MGRKTYHISRQPFVADLHTLVRNTGRRIDWDKLGNEARPDTASYKVKLAAAADVAATALTVDPLPVAIPAGTLLQFGADEFAHVTEAAAAGAESLTVQALAAAIENDDEATYTAVGKQGRRVAAGTLMAELSSGLLIPRSAVTGSETTTCILETEAVEDDDEHIGADGYGCIVGGVIYKNLLPDAANGSFATWLGELKTASAGFVFETYADSRAS